MDESNTGLHRIFSSEGVVKAAAAALIMLVLFLGAATLKTFREYRFVGSGVSASNTITVNGMGEVFAVPDVATFSVTIEEEAGDVAAAQETATQKTNDIIAYLEQEGIEERDIQTTEYNVYPQYDYVQEIAREGVYTPGRQVLRGYQVSQTISVKVRDTDAAGGLLSGVGSRGASRVSGLSFTIDDEDELKAEARAAAIADAKSKADELAGQLGVDIVRVVGFYEDVYGDPIPFAARGGVMMAMDTAMAESAPAPQLPVGENKLTSNVSITYEIR